MPRQKDQQRLKELESVCTNCGKDAYLTLDTHKAYAKGRPYLKDKFVKVCSGCNMRAQECKCI